MAREINNTYVRIGLDRFLAKKWCDYSLELFLTSRNVNDNYALLRNWLSFEIVGKEACRKTANQLKRLWLNPSDEFQALREWAEKEKLADHLPNRIILHYGMAINVFPIFQDVCMNIGKLISLQGQCKSSEVKNRIIEKYGNPESINRIVDRVIQTLLDWGLIVNNQNVIETKHIQISDYPINEWLFSAILYSSSRKQMAFSDLVNSPLRLTISTLNARLVIGNSTLMHIQRQDSNHERVYLTLTPITPPEDIISKPVA